MVKIEEIKEGSSTRTRSVKPCEEAMPEPVNPWIHGRQNGEPWWGKFNNDETSSPA